MYGAPNPINDPEKFGVTFVATGPLEEGNYDYYVFGVVKNDEGYYLSTDSGCSCYSPWESHGDLDDFTGPLTAEQVREEVHSLWKAANESPYRTTLPWFEVEDDLKAVV